MKISIRLSLLTIILVLFSNIAISNPIDTNQAKNIALKFFDRSAKDITVLSIKYTHLQPNSSIPAFYVIENKGVGFCLVSADDIFRPILGFSNKANAYTQDIPSNVKTFFDDIASEMSYVIQVKQLKGQYKQEPNNSTNDMPMFFAPGDQQTGVQPLLTTTWNQNDYYNNLCPSDTSGPNGHAYAGCVATSMGQIINYWQFPTQPRGYHSYYAPNYSSNYTLSVNYDTVSYDYSLMVDNLDNATNSQRYEVAKLLYHCGVAINMDYNWNESSAFSIVARAALVSNFKYNPKMSYIERKAFSFNEWTTLLKTDLDSLMPILYDGNGSSGGHSFICDGYTDNNYFHFNWGWSGYWNGYYALSALQPKDSNSSSVYDFSSSQAAVIGIKPTNANSENAIILTNQGTSTYKIDKPLNVYSILGNNSYTSENYSNYCWNNVSFYSNDSSRLSIQNVSYNGQSLYNNYLDINSNTIDSIAFSSDSTLYVNYYGNFYYDGFQVRIAKSTDSCKIPTNLNILIDTTTATLSWKENGNATSWTIEYGLTGFLHGQGTTISSDTTSVEIPNLTPLALYDFYVLSNCSNDSAWSKCLTAKIQPTLLMPSDGYKETSVNSAILYDDGGEFNPHTKYGEGIYTIHTSDSNNKFRITVYSYLDHCNSGKAFLEIFEGDSNSFSRIFDTYCSGNSSFCTSSNTITVKFKADDSYPTQGFKILINEIECKSATGVYATWVDSTRVKLSWDNVDTISQWTIEYDNKYFDGQTSHAEYFTYSDSNSIIINNPNPHQSLYYTIYSNCNGYICDLYEYCPCVYPQNLQLTYDDDSLRFTWDSDIDSIVWTIYNWNGMDTHTYNHYLTISYECDNYYYITGNCDPISTYFGGSSSSSCSYDYRYGPSCPTCPSVSDFSQMDASPNSIIIRFHPIDTIATYIVSYKEQDSSDYMYDTIDFDTSTYDYYNTTYIYDTITNLKQSTFYSVDVKSYCENIDLSSYEQAITCYTTLDNCIDYINLYDTNVTTTWGTYQNPYEYYNNKNNHTYWDWWYYASQSYSVHHKIFNDSTLYDYHTNYQLRTIPEGYSSSIRLGNDDIGAEAESISYNYFVDSTDRDMLILNYAVVLEDPNHTRLNQPRFTLEILDSVGGVIDTTCCFADFYAAGDLGWNSVPNTETIWKDWTTIGIDIAPYHGQTIKVRLTTYDCADGGHFGYAYFTLSCDKKRIYLVNRCDAQDSIYLHFSPGFEYKWTKVGDPTILSTTNECLVAVDTNIYQCVASFVGKPECNFTISTVSINIEPKAKMHYTIDTCKGEITFYNESYLKYDTMYTIFTKQFIDSIHWLSEDGRIFYGDTITRTFTQNGQYDMKLVCQLSNSLCVDTLDIPLDINYINYLQLIGDSICQGDSLTIQVMGTNDANAHYLWNTTQTSNQIRIKADTLTPNYSVNVQAFGCNYDLTKQLTIYPPYLDTIRAEICADSTYNLFNFNKNTTGIFYQNLQSQYGCDSVVVLNLIVHNLENKTITETICDNELFDFNGKNLNSSGTYIDTLSTIFGCDSVVSLSLIVNPTSDPIIDKSICSNEYFDFNGRILNQQGTYFDTLSNIFGCDSNITLNLTINPISVHKFSETICDNNPYYFADKDINHSGTYFDTLLSYNGCDSIPILDLTVLPTHHSGYDANTCDDSIYTYYGVEYPESGTFIRVFESANGCDSIVTLRVNYINSYHDTITATIDDGQSYYFNGESLTSSGTYIQENKTLLGCDSNLVLILSVNVGLENIDEDHNVQVFPNPAKKEITLYTDNLSNVNVLIYDIYGKQIGKYFISNQNETLIDVSNLSPGTYYIHFKNNEYYTIKKLIIL